MMNLVLRCIFIYTSNGYLTCCKIFRYGTDGFTSPPEEGVLRIFIALGRVQTREPWVHSQAR
jgi:hypothetical protein